MLCCRKILEQDQSNDNYHLYDGRFSITFQVSSSTIIFHPQSRIYCLGEIEKILLPALSLVY